MRLVTFRDGRGTRIGALDEAGTVLDLAAADPALPRDMLALIAGGPEALAAARAAMARAPVAEGARLLAPIPRPAKNVFCVGKNYHEHAKEFASSGFDATAKEVVPEAPVVFSKPPTSVIGPHEPIPSFLDPTGSTDYEGEIAVVIGKGGRGIAEAEAYAHVFGYTIVNDVTARTLQHRHRQWILGKGIDGFCPMGPAIVTADAAGVPPRLSLSTWVNGELRQRAPVTDLIFGIPTLIATISAAITLEPGDIIATGTPAGVGIGFTPPRFLKPGDVVRIEVPGIGVLENPVA
ncbi:fumarylacetoacetate hydrolase family protein [Roseomonas alkaliterrae]|uniref:2-keto-4-pentenoate hydratase/2-oxohepta-3-ene-1,7-dioic acid hydratase in catechol pathway n=1 Tax=Neoroseomonas alkaliterrae TaxID=1452450 RepID=A0A840XL91_9PROT|nr:fumarylacetoacetate hydrolase family protein [Neoroseomonas alkaliterrae]MBB5688686.1 2-keto-4-pentenoate hydratase/2-oxohepta-3-ene-1,7-dioic acid hydratase in catechol pathway [Neoroseomonas alkaliterrae]MBR0675239.1 fumarylacetoacetate hydrolase family protein [Neoroseomonas alkaliterrae]